MPPDPAEGGSGGDVDESLYSRQLYVMGHEAQVCCQTLEFPLLSCACSYSRRLACIIIHVSCAVSKGLWSYISGIFGLGFAHDVVSDHQFSAAPNHDAKSAACLLGCPIRSHHSPHLAIFSASTCTLTPVMGTQEVLCANICVLFCLR